MFMLFTSECQLGTIDDFRQLDQNTLAATVRGIHTFALIYHAWNFCFQVWLAGSAFCDFSITTFMVFLVKYPSIRRWMRN